MVAMQVARPKRWLTLLAGVLSAGSALSQEFSPPALLPPSTFAARIAAQPLVPRQPDLSVPSDWQPVVSAEPIPAVECPSMSLQADYDAAMRFVPAVEFPARSQDAAADAPFDFATDHSSTSSSPDDWIANQASGAVWPLSAPDFSFRDAEGHFAPEQENRLTGDDWQSLRLPGPDGL
jgi:hypothetical protein